MKRALRFGLIVAEVALTSLLLVGAGLTLRSFQTVLSQPAGIETDHRLTFRLGLPGARYKGSEAAARFYGELEARLAAEPMIQAAGGTMLPPLTGLDGRRGVVIENREVGPDDGPTRAHPRVVTSQLHSGGRRARSGKAAASCPATPARRCRSPIVNETMAKRYWPGQSPLGKRVRFTDQENWREVVGIIGDVKHWGLDAPVNPELYLPTTQFPTFAHDVGAEDERRSARADSASCSATCVSSMPNLPLFQVRTMEEVAARIGGAPPMDDEPARRASRCSRW